MTGLFGTLNTSSSGMRAQQIALQTTSHNLTNMNTHGYSRQRVTMSTSFPQSMAGIGQLGTGVQISGVVRVSDEYITKQLQNELSSLTEHTNISEVIGQLEAIFNEPSENGISQQMSDFFVSWGNLGENPEKIEAKKLVVSQAQSFVETVNHLANQIDRLATDTGKQIKQEIDDFNEIASQLKSLNDQIFNATVKGEHPNDLYDSQDRLVGQLVDIAGVEASKRDSYGRIMISLNNKTEDGDPVKIVTESGTHKLLHEPQATDGKVTSFTFQVEGGHNVKIEKGSIKGFEKAHEEVVKKGNEIDNFMEKLATAVNFISTNDGEDPENSFFEIGTSAKDIRVNSDLIKNAGDLIVGKTVNGSEGDGSRAKAIADLKNIALDFNKNSFDLEFDPAGSFTIKSHDNGSPIYDHYNDIVTDMGTVKQRADNMMANQSDLASLLEQRQESVSGVDLNEEVVDMIRFQSAYQANARVISTINEMLDTLINRMGV